MCADILGHALGYNCPLPMTHVSTNVLYSGEFNKIIIYIVNSENDTQDICILGLLKCVVIHIAYIHLLILNNSIIIQYNNIRTNRSINSKSNTKTTSPGVGGWVSPVEVEKHAVHGRGA